MKAISLWQPWASAIAVGAKCYETRSWPAVSGGGLYSGWLAIHASKRTKEPKEDGGEELSYVWLQLCANEPMSAKRFISAGFSKWEKLPLGAVVAVGWLKASHRTEKLHVSSEENNWGGFGSGRFAWEFSEVWRLNTPLPVRGEQKLFDVDMPPSWQDQATKVF